MCAPLDSASHSYGLVKQTRGTVSVASLIPHTAFDNTVHVTLLIRMPSIHQGHLCYTMTLKYALRYLLNSQCLLPFFWGALYTTPDIKSAQTEHSYYNTFLNLAIRVFNCRIWEVESQRTVITDTKRGVACKPAYLSFPQQRHDRPSTALSPVWPSPGQPPLPHLQMHIHTHTVTASTESL